MRTLHQLFQHTLSQHSIDQWLDNLLEIRRQLTPHLSTVVRKYLWAETTEMLTAALTAYPDCIRSDLKEIKFEGAITSAQRMRCNELVLTSGLTC